MLPRFFTPTPELADTVEGYWCVPIGSKTATKQHYATPLFEGMMFNFTNLKEYSECEGKTIYMTKRAYVMGQARGCTVISGKHEDGGYLIGVKFKPLGLAKITGIGMVHLAGNAIDAEDIWGNELEWLCEAMQEANTIDAAIVALENFLKKQLRSIRLHYRVDQVAGALSLMQAHKGNITIKELQYLTNTSRKTLERSFMNFHGLKPKVYNQIIRFNVARALMDNVFSPNLTKMGCSLGYFDQSHFIKDFKRFSGQTPTEYLDTIEEERRKRSLPVD